MTDMKIPKFNLPHYFTGRRRTPTIKASTVFVLTSLGKEEVDSFPMDGVKFNVLAAMTERGTWTTTKLSNVTGINYKNLKLIMGSLLRSGYVRVASSEE
jgi:hypothetical protein